MKDTTLLKTALICALTGLIVLALATKLLEPDYSPENGIFSDNILKLKGRVNDVKQSENSLILEISETKTTKAILYKTKEFNLTKGADVEIIGKAGKGIIVVDKIRLID